jgi:hypothetical protein
MTTISTYINPAGDGCNMGLRELKALEIAAQSKIAFTDGA